VQASFLLSRRDDHHERDGAGLGTGLGTRDHHPPAGRGEFLLVTNCARCHAVGRSGTSPHPAAPHFRTLSRRYKIEGLAEALAEGLSTGHPDMPEFVFAPEDVGAIIKYLQSIQQQ
jgi:cytochrome c